MSERFDIKTGGNIVTGSGVMTAKELCASMTELPIIGGLRDRDALVAEYERLLPHWRANGFWQRKPSRYPPKVVRACRVIRLRSATRHAVRIDCRGALQAWDVIARFVGGRLGKGACDTSRRVLDQLNDIAREEAERVAGGIA